MAAAAGLFAVERSITAYARRLGDNRALLALAECSTCKLRERNLAVWALGQLEESSGLPVLERLRTGTTCDHGRRLCEYELDKAIRKIKGLNGLQPVALHVREALGLRR